MFTLKTVKLLSFALILTLCFSCSKVVPSYDYFLFVDVSGSMEKERLFSNTIQRELQSFVRSTIKEGDRVFLFTFASQTRSYGEFEIKKIDDIDALNARIDNLEAKGKYTDIDAMLSDVKLMLLPSRAEDNARVSIVIVLSDGLNDPPRESSSDAKHGQGTEAKVANPDLDSLSYWDHSSTPEYSENLQEKEFLQETYVYYVDLSKLYSANITDKETAVKSEGNQKKTLADMESKLKESFGANSKVIQDTSQDGFSELNKNIARIDNSYIYDLLLDLLQVFAGLAIIVLFILFLNRYSKRNKLKGFLSYEDVQYIGYDDPIKLNLSKLNSHKMQLGNKFGADLRLHDLFSDIFVRGKDGKKKRVRYNFVLKARRFRDRTYLQPQVKDIDFYALPVHRDKNLIAPGDQFKIGNYLFTYEDDAKKA